MSSVPNIALPQPQGSLVLDLDGTITHWSTGAASLYGWQANDVVGQPLPKLFPEQNVAELRAELSRVREGHELRAEKFSRKADGAPLWVDVHATLMLDVNGAPSGILAVVQDATERRRLAAEVLRQTEMEHHLIAMVSHDLRNPLSAITLSASLGLAHTEEPKLRRLLERIQVSANRGVRLIHDLLDFNLMQHGGALPIQRQTLDLGPVVKEQLDEVLFSRPEREVKLELDGDLTGNWDPDRVSQVVSNLVSNALHHTTEEVLVAVRVTGYAHHVELSVHDQGAGIAPDVRKRLFQPFVRGIAGNNTGRSVGLGLFITRAIVEAHGGTVTCQSEPGRGTTFTVLLPREGRST